MINLSDANVRPGQLRMWKRLNNRSSMYIVLNFESRIEREGTTFGNGYGVWVAGSPRDRSDWFLTIDIAGDTLLSECER